MSTTDDLGCLDPDRLDVCERYGEALSDARPSGRCQNGFYPEVMSGRVAGLDCHEVFPDLGFLRPILAIRVDRGWLPLPFSPARRTSMRLFPERYLSGLTTSRTILNDLSKSEKAHDIANRSRGDQCRYAGCR